MIRVLLFLLLTTPALSQWYDCSNTWEWEERPENSFNYTTFEESPWYTKALAICKERKHEWIVKRHENGPVEGGPFVKDDSTHSILHEVLNRDFTEFKCVRCRTIQTIIKWKVRCKVIWRKK